MLGRKLDCCKYRQINKLYKSSLENGLLVILFYTALHPFHGELLCRNSR